MSDEIKEVSFILKDENFKWVDINEQLPEIDKKVAVRIINKKYPPITAKENEISYMEIIKIASWDGDDWKIAPPYPYYEFDAFVDHEYLKDGSEITHWSEAPDDMMDNWNHKLDPAIFIEKLELHIDEHSEEDIMRSIYIAETAVVNQIQMLNKSTEPFDEVRGKNIEALYRALMVLQTLRLTKDYNGVIRNPITQEELEKLQAMEKESKEEK